MSKKLTVYCGGNVAEPFRPIKAEDNKGMAVWFYASRGNFTFLLQASQDGKWGMPIEFNVSTRMLRKALALVDSARISPPAPKNYEDGLREGEEKGRRVAWEIEGDTGDGPLDTRLVHAIAECMDCGAKFQNYLNAQVLAAKHAKNYGHKVNGEIGLVFSYGGSAVPAAKEGEKT